jgi:hypothetical protein
MSDEISVNQGHTVEQMTWRLRWAEQFDGSLVLEQMWNVWDCDDKGRVKTVSEVWKRPPTVPWGS